MGGTRSKERAFTIDDEHAVVVRDGHLINIFVAAESRGLAPAHSANADHSTGDRLAFRIKNPSLHLLFRSDFCPAGLKRDLDWFDEETGRRKKSFSVKRGKKTTRKRTDSRAHSHFNARPT